MANLSINGSVVRPPKTFSASIQTIDADSTGRNASGKMIRDIIAEKVKLDIAWGPLSDSEISQILTKVSGAFFSVSYPDPQVGGNTTKRFYVGDRTAASYSWNDKFQAMKWEGLSLSFIEE